MGLQRYDSNPFIRGMVVPMEGRRVQLSTFGKDDNILVNQSTGEVLGTHVTTFKKVDTEKFVKLFSQNIALTFDLNSAGIKAFNILIWAVQKKALGKDIVMLDSITLEDFIEDQEKDIRISVTTYKRGLNELEKSQIIAKAKRKGWYYINPNFIFNGDRIAFTTLIERENNKDLVL